MRRMKPGIRNVCRAWGMVLLFVFAGLSACYDNTSKGVVTIVPVVEPGEPAVGTTVTLSAFATSTSGRRTTLSDWSQKPGNTPVVEITQVSPGSGEATFVAPAAGSELIFLIDAWEIHHPEANASETLTLTIGEQIIVSVDVSPDTPQPGDIVTLDSSASRHPLDRPLSFGDWTQDAGSTPVVELTQLDAGIATFVAPAEGSRVTFSEDMWVTDDPTQTAVATATVTVGEPPPPTYDVEIKPIIDDQCQVCHKTTTPPLGTYAEVKASIDAGKFRPSVECDSPNPPCMTGRNFGNLSEDQQLLLIEWLDAGAPEN